MRQLGRSDSRVDLSDANIKPEDAVGGTEWRRHNHCSSDAGEHGAQFSKGLRSGCLKRLRVFGGLRRVVLDRVTRCRNVNQAPGFARSAAGVTRMMGGFESPVAEPRLIVASWSSTKVLAWQATKEIPPADCKGVLCSGPVKACRFFDAEVTQAW